MRAWRTLDSAEDADMIRTNAIESNTLIKFLIESTSYPCLRD